MNAIGNVCQSWYDGGGEEMPTRNINLTERLDRFIEVEVRSGRYGNASEVVREGLRLMERRQQEERAKLKWLRGAVQQGLEEIDRGAGLELASVDELDEVMNRIGEEASAAVVRPGRRG
jgi:antitoxin ParD1/3/4